MSFSASAPKSEEQALKNTQHVCLRSSRSILAYAFLPQVSISTLWKDFDDEFASKFEAAIQKLVEQNPVLSGTLSISYNKVAITKGVFQPKDHSFCSFVEHPGNRASANYKSPREMTAQEKLDIMVLVSEDSFPPHRWAITDAWNKNPLFEVFIMRLRDDFAVTSFRINHMVGDASTRVLLENQLQQIILNEHQVKPINWSNDEKLFFRIDYDSSSYSWRELIITYLGELTLYSRLLVPASWQRVTGSVLLCKKKIDDMKNVLKRDDVPFLTSNDIILAALAQQQSKSYGCVSVTKNFRGQKTASGNTIAECNDAGNYLRLFYLLQSDASDPNKGHSLARSTTPVETGKLPSWTMLAHTDLVTTSIRNLGEKPNKRYVCRTGSQSFASFAVWHFVIINDFDDDYVCLAHNDRLDTNGNGLLQKIIA